MLHVITASSGEERRGAFHIANILGHFRGFRGHFVLVLDSTLGTQNKIKENEKGERKACTETAH